MRHSDRGMILAVTMMMALVAAIVSYGVLQLAVSQGRQGRFFRTQTQARYLAEAGMVLARERLRTNPSAFCTPTALQIDADGDGTLEPWETVTITDANCGPGNIHDIHVLVDN